MQPYAPKRWDPVESFWLLEFFQEVSTISTWKNFPWHLSKIWRWLWCMIGTIFNTSHPFYTWRSIVSFQLGKHVKCATPKCQLKWLNRKQGRFFVLTVWKPDVFPQALRHAEVAGRQKSGWCFLYSSVETYRLNKLWNRSDTNIE